MTYHAYVAEGVGAQLMPHTYEPDTLGPHDVEVKITHCGVCHSDVHIVDGDWGNHHPAVPGHEIVGHVTDRGALVTDLAIGTRVGIGWQAGSCMTCEWCVAGETNLCPDSVQTCMGRPGGFADYIRVDGRFAHALPDALDSVNAAPLLCAGITVYAPLKHFNVRPADRVGVIGIGGLGHLALQFASKMGCEVWAFTSSPEKAEEARALGAHYVINSRDEEALRGGRNSLDVILSTVHAELKWSAYLKALRPDGRLVLLGAVEEPLKIRGAHLLNGRKSISGSPIGDRATMREMLAFAARHDIVAQTETLPMTQANDAMDRVRENAARYRMVLVNEDGA